MANKTVPLSAWLLHGYNRWWVSSGPFWAHLGPYGPRWPVWARVSPARAHAVHETISEITTFRQEKKTLY